jgi:hypothetical protein
MGSKSFLENVSFESILDASSSTDVNASVSVLGGISVGKSLFAGIALHSPSIFEGGVRVATVSSIPLVGTGLVNTAGTFSVNSLQPQITSVGTLTQLTSSGIVIITDTTNSTSSSSGSLQVAGGVGIGKSLYVGTSLTVDSSSEVILARTSSTYLFIQSIAQNRTRMGSYDLSIAGYRPISIESPLTLTGTTDAILNSADTRGTLFVEGGATIKKNLIVNGQTLHLQSSATSTHLQVHNTTANSFSQVWLIGNSGSGGGMFLNSSGRTADGGENNLTLRNDVGDLRLQNKSQNATMTFSANSNGIYVDAELFSGSAYWIRKDGNNGLYWQTHGGGLFMQDTSWIRAYNDKGFLTGGQMNAGSMMCNGNMTINGGLSAPNANATAWGFIGYDFIESSNRMKCNGAFTCNGTLLSNGLLTLSTDKWHNSTDGYARTYYGTNSRTYWRSGNGFEWRNSGDEWIADINSIGLLNVPARFCRTGVPGYTGASGNIHNFWWTGANMQVWVDNVNVGTISGVTSDYRIKQDVSQMTDSALSRVFRMRPVTFRYRNNEVFTESDKFHEGFIAHELERILPSAVHGEKDGTRTSEDGIVDPVFQTLDPIPIIAVLTKAIQELAQEVKMLREGSLL